MRNRIVRPYSKENKICRPKRLSGSVCMGILVLLYQSGREPLCKFLHELWLLRKERRGETANDFEDCERSSGRMAGAGSWGGMGQRLPSIPRVRAIKK